MFLVKNGPDREITFKRPEGCLDLDELQIELPELRGVSLGEISAQEVAPFAAADLRLTAGNERPVARQLRADEFGLQQRVEMPSPDAICRPLTGSGHDRSFREHHDLTSTTL